MLLAVLPYVALSLAVLFFALLRLGILDDLARGARRRGSRSVQTRGKLPKSNDEPELAKRLEVFKDFLEGDDEQER